MSPEEKVFRVLLIQQKVGNFFNIRHWVNDCLMAGKGSEVANTFICKHHVKRRANTSLDDLLRRKLRLISYLDELVPAGGDNDGVLGVGAEANAGDPLGVALVGDGELAVTEGVPQLDGAVTGTGDDLTVVGGEGDGQNIVGVADKGAGGVTGGQLPETERLVPGGGQSVGTVGGDHLYAQKKTSGQPNSPIAPVL